MLRNFKVSGKKLLPRDDWARVEHVHNKWNAKRRRLENIKECIALGKDLPAIYNKVQRLERNTPCRLVRVAIEQGGGNTSKYKAVRRLTRAYTQSQTEAEIRAHDYKMWSNAQ